jgi:CDP-4-dehydro-6-deoxyglucose reductase
MTVTTETFTYALQSMELLHGNIWQVFLTPPQKKYLQYKAGQYLEIFNPAHDPRPFSIANAPIENNGIIELHIRCVANSPYTLSLIENIKKTRTLDIRGPFGQCTYKKIPEYPSIFIAGGTGFAPIKAIIEQALSEKITQPIYLYWGARTQADLYMNELASQWEKDVSHFQYIPVLSASLEADHWTGKTGFLHDAVLADHPDLTHHHVYASGPQEMVYAALDIFKRHGLDEKLMYSDAFDFPPIK